MTDCLPQVSFSFHPKRPIDVRFDAPEVSSEGGLVLLREAEERLGLCARVARCLVDTRTPAFVEHSREEQVRQRVFQIALGYEDCNDANHLRSDPLLNIACDRDAAQERGLSSQPTLSRFENAMDGRSLRAMLEVLEDSYVRSLSPGTKHLILDVDSTDDPCHGHQQLSFFHGYYDQHMYHPLLITDGDGQLVSAILRPGNVHASRGAVGVLLRLIRKVRARFPNARILVRADSGFCIPRILEQLENERVHYIVGLARNARIVNAAEPFLAEARKLAATAEGHTARCYGETEYAAETWNRKRRVLIKAEVMAKGDNPRFVVTNLRGDPKDRYENDYCARGNAENRIKDLKNALSSDRLSCSKFRPNFFRLLLHAVAYRLLFALRLVLKNVAPAFANMQFDTLRLRLLKVAVIVAQSVRRFLLRMPSAFPLASVFVDVAHSLRAAR